jgi:hypothetical protein
VDPDALKLAEEIEASRKEIEKLQERVRQLVARRGKRAELVKSTHILTTPELPAKPASVTPNGPRVAHNEELGRELSLEEGMAALRSTTISQVRLIAFKHGAVVFLLENEKTLTVRMDERGPKPLLDLLSANEHKTATAAPARKALDSQARP